jgi:uncharacterized membrane protein YkoI
MGALRMRGFDPIAISLAIALSIVASQAVWADSGELRDRSDHDRARLSFQQGQLRSLSQLLEELGPQFGGEIIEVELMRNNGTYHYQFRVLAPNGQVSVHSVDAASGKVIQGNN